MRYKRFILAFVLGSGLMLAALIPTAASAKAARYEPIPPEAIGIYSEYPTVVIHSASRPPAGFETDLRQALQSAKSYGPLIKLHARQHPLTYDVQAELGGTWAVNFFYKGKIIAQVLESGVTAQVIGYFPGLLASTPYARGDFFPHFGQWWVLVIAGVAFLLPLIDPRRLFRLVVLDGVAVLAFLVSYLLFDHAHLVPSVWLAYPPLIYLLIRALALGGLRVSRRGLPHLVPRRPRKFHGRVAPLLPLPILALGVVLMLVGRALLSVHTAGVEDAGFAAVAGAYRIIHGLPIYYHSGSHYDTYGPLMYLLYVPVELLFHFNGTWTDATTARAEAITFDLLTTVGLVVLGWQWRRGKEGLRLGLALGWMWVACPWTLLCVMSKTNDGLVALLVVLSLIALRSSIASGLLVGIAAATKFVPAGLIGLFAWPARRGRRDAAAVVVVFVLVIVVSVLSFTPPGGLKLVYNDTIGWQLNRTDVFSPWALHPGLKPVQDLVELLVAILCVGLMFAPRSLSRPQMAALSAAVMIAVQLPELHWFYFYIDWFLPALIVSWLATDAGVGEMEGEASPAVPEPASLVPT